MQVSITEGGRDGGDGFGSPYRAGEVGGDRDAAKVWVHPKVAREGARAEVGLHVSGLVPLERLDGGRVIVEELEARVGTIGHHDRVVVGPGVPRATCSGRAGSGWVGGGGGGGGHSTRPSVGVQNVGQNTNRDRSGHMLPKSP